MAKALFILNDQPYGTERSYNALRLAGSLSKVAGEEVRILFMGDAVSCAKSGQKVPEGFYNLELMIARSRERVQRLASAVPAWTLAASLKRKLSKAHIEARLRTPPLGRNGRKRSWCSRNAAATLVRN